MIQILSFQRRVAAADDGLAEVAEAVVDVVVVGVFGACMFRFGFVVVAAVPAWMRWGVMVVCSRWSIGEGVVGLHYCVLMN